MKKASTQCHPFSVNHLKSQMRNGWRFIGSNLGIKRLKDKEGPVDLENYDNFETPIEYIRKNWVPVQL